MGDRAGSPVRSQPASPSPAAPRAAAHCPRGWPRSARTVPGRATRTRWAGASTATRATQPRISRQCRTAPTTSTSRSRSSAVLASKRAISVRSSTRRARWCVSRTIRAAASPAAPLNAGASSPRTSATAVIAARGVRSSCATSAANRRERASARRSFVDAVAQRGGHPVEADGQPRDLVTALHRQPHRQVAQPCARSPPPGAAPAGAPSRPPAVPPRRPGRAGPAP